MMGGTAACAGLSPGLLRAAEREQLKKTIPSSGEPIVAMGMGTWETFDAGDDAAMRAQLLEVLQAFFDHGGQVIDSSPMYGSSEEVVGDLLRQLDNKAGLFAATKVWTDGREDGIEQMQDSMRKMGVAVMDLMQVHNLRDWRTHLATLREWKAEGRIRYIGITTSHGRAHDEFARIMETEPLDFAQFTYNIANREAEKRLLPLAADRGIATLINRPFEGSDLFDRVAGRPLPDWAPEIGCRSWAQVFLKYIISHPHVTCVIPATSRVKHMVDNMGAGYGEMPDAAMRRRMEQEFA
jgi:diketogulonate reductase-like aldo/keto reductase